MFYTTWCACDIIWCIHDVILCDSSTELSEYCLFTFVTSSCVTHSSNPSVHHSFMFMTSSCATHSSEPSMLYLFLSRNCQFIFSTVCMKFLLLLPVISTNSWESLIVAQTLEYSFMLYLLGDCLVSSIPVLIPVQPSAGVYPPPGSMITKI